MPKPRLLIFCLALALATAAVAQEPAKDPGDELRRAASEGNLARVKELLDAGADVNAANKYGGTALAFACDRERAEVVKLLLERGANPNTKDTFYGNTPLGWAAGRGNAEIVRALLEKGAEGEEDALMAAVFSDKPDVVKVVLDRGKVSPEALTNAMVTARSMQKLGIAAMLTAAGVKEPPPADFKVEAGTLKSYAGTYEAANGMVITLALQEDGRLNVTFPGSPTLTLGALDAVTFRPEQFPAVKMTFNVEGGKVSGVLVDQGGNQLQFTKKEVQQ